MNLKKNVTNYVPYNFVRMARQTLHYSALSNAMCEQNKPTFIYYFVYNIELT